MALVQSGAIGIANIQKEFGGTFKLSDYYRGGTQVPNIAVNSGVPTSGQIAISDFYGTAIDLNMTNRTISETTELAQCVAGIEFRPDGTCYEVNYIVDSPTYTQISNEWVNGDTSSTVGENYEIFAQVMSGYTGVYLNGPSFSTWHTLNTARLWTLEDITADNNSVTTNLRFIIRDKITGSIATTLSLVTLTANLQQLR